MKNLIEYEEELKGWPREALEQELKEPTGSAPSFLVFSEMERRKRDLARYQGIQSGARDNNMSMLEEALSSSMPGLSKPSAGIAQPRSPMPPKGFADGGAVRRQYYTNEEREAYAAAQREAQLAAYHEAMRSDPRFKVEQDRLYDPMTKTPASPPRYVSKPFLSDSNVIADADSAILDAVVGTPRPSPSISNQSYSQAYVPSIDKTTEDQLIALGMIPSESKPAATDAGISGDMLGMPSIPDSDPEMDRIQALIDERNKSRRNVRAESLLRMGATMMTTPGNFGTAMGAGMGDALNQYSQARNTNDETVDAALRGQVAKAELINRSRLADLDYESRIGSAQIAAAAKAATETMKGVMDQADAANYLQKVAMDTVMQKYKDSGEMPDDATLQAEYNQVFSMMHSIYRNSLNDAMPKQGKG